MTKQQVIQWLLDNGHKNIFPGEYIDDFGWKYRLFDKEIYALRRDRCKESYFIQSHAEYKDLFIDDTNGFLCGWKEYK